MKAIVQDRYGSAEVLRLEEVDPPTVGANDVLIGVRAAGVDRGVWHVMTGRPYVIRFLGFGLRHPRSRIRGTDVAGRVEAVGEDVTRFHTGDDVFGECDGAFAEYACAGADDVERMPSSLSFEQAAALTGSGCTALHAVRDAARVEPGQRVLVVGAGGGVGTFAVQIAKAFGAEVTGVCSGEKADVVRSIGADDVVDYTREDFADGRRRWNAILDLAGNRALSRLRRALEPGGTLVLVGGEEGDRFIGGLDRQLRALLLSPFVGQRLRSLFPMERSAADLRSLRELVDAGKLAPVVDRTFPLREVPDAMRHLETGRACGKIVVRV